MKLQNFSLLILLSAFGFLFLSDQQVYGQRYDLDYFQNKSKKDGVKNAVWQEVDPSLLKKAVVFDEGRIKPLDSFARTELLIINGKSTMTDSTGKKRSAIDWLARAMFTPSKALDDRVIKIVFPEVLDALGMRPHDSRRYSFNDIAARLPQLERLASFANAKEDDKRNSLEKEFLRIYSCFIRLYRIMNSFLFALPTETFRLQNASVAEKLELPRSESGVYSYLDFMTVSRRLIELAAISESKPEEKRTAEDFILIEFKNRYDSFPKSYTDLPHMFFPSFTHGGQKWFSAWQILSLSSGENLVKKEILYIKNFIDAYRNGDQQSFDQNAQSFLAEMKVKLSEDQSILKKTGFEVSYNSLDPFFRAMILYFFSFLAIGISGLLKRKKKISDALYYLSLFFMGVAMILNLYGMILRMIITDRPPITNLYTTFIFVAFVSALLCVFLYRFERNRFILFSGALTAFVMLLISGKFASEGDTMGVLIAVLRSNFWLSTHVITINLGYAGVIFSGVIAHVYLFLCLSKDQEKQKETKKSIYKMIYATQAFGLIFTVVGTLLGGIWADQSWGRFWGWDPKENGSLMIVLWSAAIFHARFSGVFREIGFAAGAVLGIVVVMIAWFGINLLGVGLHSYGFTEGIAYPFFFYVAVQFAVLFFLLYSINQRKVAKI